MSSQLFLIDVAGIAHQDPLGLPRLETWLESLRFGREHEPPFVALEYDADYFSHVVTQRPRFRQLVEQEWPFLSLEDHAALENSLGYEGDAHLKIFPNSRTVWLDKGRWGSRAKEEACGYAEDRMKVLRNCAKSIPQHPDGFLSVLSRKICAEARANRCETGDDRDKKFAELILKHQFSNGAVAIVGASHARLEVPDSFVSLLQVAGIQCQIQILESS